ncbi:AMP-binding protein [Plantactinospora sp. WMMC1484]|uniref:AMP-binding protein n=1 Tax=Plantactinospora sp. WMMC1484 TaxID=3404122 RepID=UPI003BF5294F
MAQLIKPGEQAAIADGVRALDRGALDARVNRWIHALRELGLSTGDAVAIVAANRVETYEVLLACLHTGLTVVPVNWHLTAEEMAYQMEDSASRLVVTDDARWGTVQAAASAARLLCFGPQTEALLAGQPDTEPEDQVCGSTLLYTSGTTGRPNGVVNGLFATGAPFRRVGALSAYAGTALGVPEDGTTLLAGPWYHSAQLFFSLLPLLRGARLVMRPQLDAAEILKTIEAEAVTETHLVPTQFVRLLRLPDRGRFDCSSLRRVWHGGGPCAEDVKRRMIDWWGPCLWEYYAATEGGVATFISSSEWLERPGSVGRALAPTVVEVVDDDGRPCPPGVSGRVFLRRRPERDFHYHNAPEKTAAAHLEPGVFTYGELGRLDDDGYLFLTGRHQDVIVSGGVNVYPAEVEAVLLDHSSVRDAAVLGVPDDEFGERVLAVVEADGLAAEEVATTLDRYCRTRLAGFKVPRAYLMVAQLPREATGKLRKQVLREWFT